MRFRAEEDAMPRLSNPLVMVLVATALVIATGHAAAQTYLLEVQSGGPGTVTPGTVQVPAGSNQTFTFTPDGCNIVADVTVDDVSLGPGLAEYTFTNVQSDHILYVSFGGQPTTTALDVRPVGQCAVPETLTATVPNADGGQVNFLNGATLLGTRTLAAGVATFVVSPGLPTGAYTFSATYLGTSCFYSSSSPAVPYDVADTGPTPVTLSVSLPRDTVDQSTSVVVTATLRIAGVVAGGQSGQVTFYDGNTVLGTFAMTSGKSSHAFQMDVLGVQMLRAVASLVQCPGTIASEPVTVFVSPNANATISLGIMAPESFPQVDPGDSVVVTATVPGTGTVHFLDVTNGIELGSAQIVNSVATFTYVPQSRSTFLIQAQYGGDAQHQAATSLPFFLQVGPSLPPPPPPQYPGALFSLPTLFDAVQPASAIIADVNADGRPDLVTANRSATVSVLLGNGDGSFGAHSDFPTGHNSPSGYWLPSVATADFNADGHLDLAVQNNNGFGGAVTVLMGNGDGTFGPPTDVSTGYPTSVAAADINADGRPDLVATGASASVLLGNGDGTFQPGTDVVGGNRVAIADMNGDGRPDLVVASTPSVDDGTGHRIYFGEVSVRLGNGDGTFVTGTSFPTGQSPWSLAVADLNGDGRLDVVAANRGQPLESTPGSTASVLLGNGDGTLGPKTDFDTGMVPVSVAVKDLNGDGHPDLAVTCWWVGAVSVLFGNGNGTFQPQILFSTGAVNYSVAIGDLNADGRPDLAIGNQSTNTVHVLLNVGNGTVGAPISSAGASIGESKLDFLAPNPTHNSSQIQYTVARAGRVRLDVADVAGRVVTTLFDAVQQAGRFHLAWDGTNHGGERLPAGIYFVRLRTIDRTVARKITKLP
jgi:hypothetical protein